MISHGKTMLPSDARCRSCHRLIFWATTTKGRPIPIDPTSRIDGNLVVERQGEEMVARKPDALLDRNAEKYVSHFTTCPNADEHRRR